MTRRWVSSVQARATLLNVTHTVTHTVTLDVLPTL